MLPLFVLGVVKVYKKRLQDRIRKHVDHIFAKKVLSFEDYQILSIELARIEKAEERKENERRTEELKNMVFNGGFGYE